MKYIFIILLLLLIANFIFITLYITSPVYISPQTEQTSTPPATPQSTSPATPQSTPQSTMTPTPKLPYPGDYIDSLQDKCMSCCSGNFTVENDPTYCNQYIKYKVTECENDGTGCQRTTDCFKDCFKKRQSDLGDRLTQDTLDFCRSTC